MQHFNNDLLRTVSKSLIIWYQKLLNWHFFVSPNQIHVVLCHDIIHIHMYVLLDFLIINISTLIRLERFVLIAVSKDTGYLID